MKTKQSKLTFSLVVFLLVGIIIALNGHGKGEELIKGADFYATDLFLIVPLLLLIGDLFYLTIKRNRVNRCDGNYTREVDPRWGWCGLFSLFGFLGIFTYWFDGTFFPFFFFVFIGFFGFYYEGKMSHTLRDEMYEQHLLMAKVKAMKIGLNGIYLGSLACVLLIQNARIALPFMVAMVSIFVGLSLFLESYLLYQYERVDGNE